MKIYVKIMVYVVLCSASLSVMGRDGIVFTKQITSLDEAKFVTKKMFKAFNKILKTRAQISKHLLYKKYGDGLYARDDHQNSYSYEIPVAVYHNLEAIENYFRSEFLKTMQLGAKPDDLTSEHITQWAHKALPPVIEFNAWVYYALPQANETLKLARKIVEDIGGAYYQGFDLTVTKVEQIHKRLTDLATTDPAGDEKRHKVEEEATKELMSSFSLTP